MISYVNIAISSVVYRWGHPCRVSYALVPEHTAERPFNLVAADPILRKSLTVAKSGQFEPDFYSAKLNIRWDLTTSGGWPRAHAKYRYLGLGVLIVLKRRELVT